MTHIAWPTALRRFPRPGWQPDRGRQSNGVDEQFVRGDRDQVDQQNQPGKKGWQAAPGEMARSFEAIVGALPEVEMRKMFGCTCALVLGHMFAGLHERGVFMRLSDEDRATIESQLGATPFEPMPGRIRLVDGDTELLPGLELIETSGHVPGHQSVLVRLPKTGQFY